MRISSIKNLAGDRRIAHNFTFFWNFQDFQQAMSSLPEEGSSIDSIYSAIVSVFLRKLDESNLDFDENSTINSLKRKVIALSKKIYDDKYYWAIGTKWKSERDDYIQKQAYKLERRQARAERREKLEPLYGSLHLAHIEKADIIKLIILDEELSLAIIDSMSESMTRKDLYNICEDIILPRIQLDTYTKLDLAIINKASRIAFGDKTYWAESNGLDLETINSKYYKKTD